MFDKSEDTDNEIVAWERMGGEPHRWYARFLRYKNLPYNKRKLITLFRDEKTAEIAADLKKNPGASKTVRKTPAEYTSVPIDWKQHAAKFKWSDRALAWDKFVIERDAERERELVLKARTDRLDIMKTLQYKVVKRLGEIDERDLTSLGVEGVLRAIVTIHKELRLELGDEPEDRRIRKDAGDDEDVIIEIDLKD